LKEISVLPIALLDDAAPPAHAGAAGRYGKAG
jgi:hypothetical protein